MILQMRKLKPREGGGLSKGEWDILSGALAPGFLMSFLPSVVINCQVLTLRINYWWKCKRLFKRMCLPAVHLMAYFHYTPQPLESAGHRADASPFLLNKFNFTRLYHSVSNTMWYIRTVIITVGTLRISKERKLFLGKTVKELLSIKFIPQGYFQKMKQISLIITKAIRGLLRTLRKGGGSTS